MITVGETTRDPQVIFDDLLRLQVQARPHWPADADDAVRCAYYRASLERAQAEATLRQELSDAVVGRGLPLWAVDAAAWSSAMSDRQVESWQVTVERAEAQDARGVRASDTTDGW